jgi:uncharacterized protein (DUF2336 family)
MPNNVAPTNSTSSPFKGLRASDVETLLADPAPERRSQIVVKVAAEFQREALSEAERALAVDILRAMASDAEMVVRQAVASTLRSSEDLPRDVAIKLARDDFRVAQPVLECSPVLTDQDLIAVLADGGAQKQVSIARRENVSEQVASAIIDTGNAAAVATLVENEGADLTDDLYDRTLQRYSRFETVKSAMAHRSILPVTIAERLLALVSDRLKLELATRHALSDEAASDVIVRARERATLGLLEGGHALSDTRALVHQLHSRGRLTASLMLRVLCTGDILFVEEGFAEIAGISWDKASRLVHDEGPLGLKAIYKKCALPEILFPAFRVAVDTFHETGQLAATDRESFTRRITERILTQYQEMEVGDLDFLLTKLGRLEAA